MAAAAAAGGVGAGEVLVSEVDAWAQRRYDTAEDGTNYRLVGPESADLVICIHGVGGFSFIWDSLIGKLLAKDKRVLAYDLIGRGHSAPPPDPATGYGAEGHLRQLRLLLEELGLKDTPATLVAHSMGGALATLFAASRPAQLTPKLVLLAPAGLMDTQGMFPVKSPLCCGCWPLIRIGLRSGQEKAWASDFVKHGTPEEIAMLASMRQHAAHCDTSFDAFFRSVQQFPLGGLDSQVGDLASRPDLKVLLLWGTRDTSVPFHPCFSRWSAALRNGACAETLESFKDVGHGMLLERPDLLEPAIVDFC
mmetsp:Transcript_34518/g.108661  ORF Transcript_34518/g.108661 Transcript_34518/m.108661 type:complete len:307 (-) Transcript_34518:285-1205(-)